MGQTNKDKAIALLESIQSGAQEPVGFINPNKYIQHNLAIEDGLAGFGAVLQNAPEGGFKVDVIRAFEDGDYVFVHSLYDFFGPKVGIDVFRFEDGLIVEHWDNMIDKSAAPNPSGHTQIDGETEVRDLDKTEANKATAKAFVNTVLVAKKYDEAGNFVNAENYTQHHPQIADGLAGLGAAIKEMASHGVYMNYDVNHIVLGQGNYCLAISEGSLKDNPTSYYDLLRFDDGKVVEHWGVIESIPPEAERKNSNGKFGF